MTPFFSNFPRLLSCFSLALFMSGSPVAHAEKADRDKPTNIEADTVTVDDIKKIQIFEGNVQLTKGTLIFRAERIVVTQDENGFQHSVSTGTPTLPHFRQKREGRDEYIEGEAERIEYDAKTERTDLYNRAWVKSGMDEVRGQFISYDGKTESYVVTSGPNGTRAKPGSNERVRAVIQPRNTKPASTAPGSPKAPTQADGISLKETTILSPSRKETAE
jgi:lipopolysaccharide export system protein LptA